jgi:hypothetical protein
VVFLLCYAVAVWVIAAIHRRRWPAFVAIFGGLPPVALGALLCTKLMIVAPTLEAGVSADAAAHSQRFLIYLVAGAMIVLISGVGLFIAVQPRRAPDRPCGACGYDLEGNRSGVCPECGADVTLPEKLQRRAIETPAPVAPPEHPLATRMAADPSFRSRVEEARRSALDG